MMQRIALVLAVALSVAGCGTKSQDIQLKVTENGFEPKQIEVNHGGSVTLLVTRTTDQTCATEIVVPSRGIKQELPLNQTVKVALGSVKPGEIDFACGMEMEKGTIAVR